MPPNRFESEVESFLEGSHGDRTHIKRADHHTVTPLCGTLLLLCLPTGVPGAGGPGRCVCRWAAARPRAVRAASFARRVVSKPGQASPPPTGTAARPSGSSGAFHAGRAWCAGALSGPAPASSLIVTP